MTLRQADLFEKNGRAEAEQKFDRILTKTRLPKAQAYEACEVSADLTEALVADGMSGHDDQGLQAYLV